VLALRAVLLDAEAPRAALLGKLALVSGAMLVAGAASGRTWGDHGPHTRRGQVERSGTV